MFNIYVDVIKNQTAELKLDLTEFMKDKHITLTRYGFSTNSIADLSIAECIRLATLIDVFGKKKED